MEKNNPIIKHNDKILVTGAAGFIGRKVVANLIDRGFTNIRCLIRPSIDKLRVYSNLGIKLDDKRVEIYEGNLLSQEDCVNTAKDAKIIYHLAAGRGEKSIPSAFLNSVVTTRNLLDAIKKHSCLKRFINVSSFTLYTNKNKPRGRLLDEQCPVEKEPALRGDAYCYAKVKQEELVFEYCDKYNLPYVNIRSGVVYGPGNEGIHGRIGINTFGVFLHLGGSNTIPLTFVENCAEAIVLAGLIEGIEGEIFNVVDDNLPKSRQFLRLYKKNVRKFFSMYVPHIVSYILCFLWEKYSTWSRGQLPNSYNRKDWHAGWKKTKYSNEKIKKSLGWRQKITTEQGLNKHFESCREKLKHA